MVIRFIFNYFANLANNPQVVEKLSESYPVRRAAQLTVYAFHKGKRIAGEGAVDVKMKQGAEKLASFAGRFKEEVKRGIQEASNEAKKR